MTNEPTIKKESAIVEVSPETRNLVNENMVGEPEDLKREVMALIDAIKKRAQVEAQSAGHLSQDAYLNAVNKAREAITQARVSIETNQPLLEKDRIEYSFKLLEMEAKKNWESVVKEVSTLGDRLTDAAKAAWEALTAPRHHS
ncbi:MAG: hypothetical protein WBB28_19825 [Crinalium sp.]